MLTNESRYLPYVTNTYVWMNTLWDNASTNGGYFAGSFIDGTGKSTDKYVDENSLSGNAYLDCYAVTTGTTKTNFLSSAIAIANWLICSAQWDSTFGGGFWWNTTKQLKPT